MKNPTNFFHASHQNRIDPRDPFWNGKKRAFGIAVAATFILLQLLFLGDLSYLYGSLFRSRERVHNFNVAMVNYDTGVIANSLRAASSRLQSPVFPGVTEHPISQYPSVDTLVQAVGRGDYWAAIYTAEGASDRLSAALAGGDAAKSYNSSNAITFIWNEARYAAIADGNIMSSMQTVVAASRIAYSQINGSQSIRALNQEDPAAVQIFLNPITASQYNIKPTVHGSRIMLNTISMVMPIIMQFFFLLAINGISAEFQFYSYLPVPINGMLRLTLAASFTLFGALCHSAYVYAYQEDWDISGLQFFQVCMIIWLYMHVNFVIIDTATAFIALPFLPFFLLTWIIFNVTSVIQPFELNHGFYHWGYALPSHQVWDVLIQIWSDSGYDKLYRALPILFTWEILGMIGSVIGMHFRCQKANKEARELREKEEERIAEAVSIEVKRSSQEGQVRPDGPEIIMEQEEMTMGPAYSPSVPVPFGKVLSRTMSSRV